MSCRIAFSSSNRTTNNLAIAIDTTSSTDMIHLTFRQPTTLTKTTALFSTETAKQNFKREDKSKFCVFDNSKSD